MSDVTGGSGRVAISLIQNTFCRKGILQGGPVERNSNLRPLSGPGGGVETRKVGAKRNEPLFSTGRPLDTTEYLGNSVSLDNYHSGRKAINHGLDRAHSANDNFLHCSGLAHLWFLRTGCPPGLHQYKSSGGSLSISF